MFKNRKQDHIGLAVTDIEAASNWYTEVLGFHTIGAFNAPDGTAVRFLQNQEVVYEIYQPVNGVAAGAEGKIDHYSFVSDDIERDYKYCAENGYQICTDGIESIPTFWEKGIRYFKLKSPTGEEVEFCQKL